MEPLHIVWSACTTTFKGAGLYLGIATPREVEAVQSGMTDKQARVYRGTTVRLRETQSSPLTYFAVRDPSAVRVKPIDRPPLPNGFRHVKLLFSLDRPASKSPAQTVNLDCDPESQARATDSPALPAFVLTVGMAGGREEDFFQKFLCEPPDQTWGDLFRRFAAGDEE